MTIIEKGIDLLALVGLQRAIRDVGTFQVVGALVLLAAVGVFVDWLWMYQLHKKMPPGPMPWPIIGNTYQLPDEKPWILFEELAKKYKTQVLTFWIGRNPTVWICDAWAASDLLDKRAGIYSSRPHMVVFGALGTGQNNLVTMTYGERWRLHRKLTHMGVGLQQVRNYKPFQDDESRIVAYDVLRKPEQYVMHFERYAASVVSIIGYGRRIASDTDPIITEVIAVMQRAAELNVPGKTFPMLLETFPILSYFPPEIAPWMHGLRRGGGRAYGFFYALAEEAATESKNHNYMKAIFDENDKNHLSKKEIASLSGNLFGAGSDTSSSTLVTFVLACCAFPECLPKAWEELDRVVGNARSPDLGDAPSLPYVNAFVKEVFRWRSVAIIGGQPHAPIQDDYYKGWLIPKDTSGRLRPREVFTGGKRNRPFPNEKGYMTFGWGRRVCSGQGLAEQGTWITVARLLWGFWIRKAVDEKGREVPVDIFAYTNGLNMRPRPFACRIQPRTETHRQTIEREGLQALEDLSVYEGETRYRMSTFYRENPSVE